jgi:DNA-binding ferritin-like protein
MEKKEIADLVMGLFVYADVCKMIHYTTEQMHCHTLCDDVRDTIMEFADELAEKAFGHTGKPSFEDFSMKLTVKKTQDIAEVCNKCIELVEGLRKTVADDDTYSGIVSIIDDFKSDMAQKIYLATFDDVEKDAKVNEEVDKLRKWQRILD